MLGPAINVSRSLKKIGDPLAWMWVWVWVGTVGLAAGGDVGPSASVPKAGGKRSKEIDVQDEDSTLSCPSRDGRRRSIDSATRYTT